MTALSKTVMDLSVRLLIVFRDYLMNVSAVYSDGPVVDLDFTPTTDNLGLGAMGTPSEFDRRKKKK